MKKFLLISLVILLLFLGLTFWILPHLPEWERDLLQDLANRSAKEYFDGSLRIEKVSLDRYLKVRLTGITGNFKTRRGPVPLEIASVESQDPVYFFITEKPVRFIFSGFRPRGCSRPGTSGTFMIQSGKDWRIEFDANLSATDLEDWQWLEPDNLEGSTGSMKGAISFRQSAGQEAEFSMDLEAPQPGGHIQARFFDIFLPYLPTTVQKQKVQKVVQSKELVRYDQAALKVSLPQSDNLKILLEIFIPVYNLKLKLNANIKTDQKDAFAQIARIMGLIEVKS
jgi:hypothetical protein